MPEFYCNPTPPPGVKCLVATRSRAARVIHVYLSFTIMWYVFFALILATALLAMDTARKVRDMVSPSPVRA